MDSSAIDDLCVILDSSTHFATEWWRGPMIRADARYRLVLITCASIAEARTIAQRVVERKLAACANIVPRVESIYRWKGRVARAKETLLMIKTTAARLRKLESEVKRLHSYDVPEFVAIPFMGGSREYLAWIAENTKPADKS